MYKSIKLFSVFLLALAGNLHAGEYVSFNDLTITSIEYKSFNSSNGFILTLDGLPENTGCSATDTLKVSGRWASDTTSEFTNNGTNALYTTALTAYSLGKKVNIRVFDTICSATTGFYIYHLTVKN